MTDRETFVQALYEDAGVMLGMWQSSFSAQESRFGHSAVVKACGLLEDEAVFDFAGPFPGGHACWRFPLALLRGGFGMVASKLALDLTVPLSEPDEEGIRWVGEG